MKKNLLLTLLILIGASSCKKEDTSESNSNSLSSNFSTSSSEVTTNNNSSITSSSLNNSPKTVVFDLNYETENEVYLNLIIFPGQSLSEPQEPTRRDYLFNGWYLDRECTIKFEKFNQELEDNLTLYASWIDYSTISDDVKINRFISKVKELSGNVNKATVVCEGIETYYTPMEASYPVYQKAEYNRYKDITTVDYYTEEEEQYGAQQYFYDDEQFYNIYDDIEGQGNQSNKQVAKFDETKIDNHLNIDFINLYGSLLLTLSNQIKNGHSYDELSYEMNLNETYLDPFQESYEFQVYYYLYQEDVNFGSVEEIYMMEYGFTFLNGKIKRSRVVEQYMLGIQGEVQYAIQNNIYTTYETTDEYQDFEGDRFDPSNYEVKN